MANLLKVGPAWKGSTCVHHAPFPESAVLSSAKIVRVRTFGRVVLNLIKPAVFRVYDARSESYVEQKGHGVPIIFYCPKCGREIRVRTAAAGRSGRCTGCGEKIVIPDFRTFLSHPPSAASAESSENIPTITDGFLDDEAAKSK